jgi:hypothetical protein
MPQLTIDPRNIPEALSDTVSITPILPRARDFGCVPDLRRCEAGDLVLSFSISPNFAESQIIRAQTQAGFSADDSRWTHVAVFLYQDFVLEAVPWEGVITRSLYSDIPDSVLRVRRRPDLRVEEKYKIAMCAQRMLGTRYDISAALSLGWRSSSHLQSSRLRRTCGNHARSPTGLPVEGRDARTPECYKRS